jgi:MFS family permease
LGAGGGQNSSAAMANIANSVLYGVFALAAVGAGSLLNIIGPRISILFACTGYPIYSGAMWYFSVTGNLWYPVFAGAYLGFAAALLWTTAIFMANAYAEENAKARWRAVEWIFNMGGASIGAAVALGISWNATTSSVPPSVYITFIILQCCSSGFAFFVLPPDKLRRSDGTSLARFNRLSIRDSLNITGKLFKDWRVLMLIPVMFTPEMFYPFQATINAVVFNLRTRTLNGLLNTLIQLPTTALLAWIMDNQRFGSRKKRVIIAITYNTLLVTGSYIAQTAWLRAWKFDISLPGPEIDFTDQAYRGAVVIYLFYAAQYGTFQSCVLYVLATFTNDLRKSAAIGGLYVGGEYLYSSQRNQI